MVIDANTGQVLHQQSGDELRYPASLTKMMTLYLAFELIEQGRLAQSTRIKISEEAAQTSPSRLGLAAGSDIALIDALKIISVKSANDIAVAVAEHIAGTEAKFALLMTKKARALGMTQTTFRNAHGLPHPEQTTTARDMLTLAMRLQDDFPKQYAVFGLKSFSYGGVTYRNHNTMLMTYPGMDGLKTGYTTPAGFNLVASVRRNGRHVVAAVFGGSTASARNAHMRTILDRALAKASTERTRLAVPVARLARPDRFAAASPAAAAGASLPAAAARRLVRTRRAETQTVAAELPDPERAREVAEASATPRERPGPTEVQITKVRPVAIAAPRRAEPEHPAEMLRQSPAPEPAVAPVSAAPEPLRAAEPPAAPPSRLAAFSTAGVGAAPSSLQAQADRLQRGEAPVRPVAPPPVELQRHASATFTSSPAAAVPAMRLNGPEPAPRAPARPAAGGVAIQIGAYVSEAEARRRLAETQSRMGPVLAGASPATEPVQSGGRQLFRARFVGLDAAAAATACTELRRAQVDCLVAKGP